jgi:hypothetical protein
LKIFVDRGLCQRRCIADPNGEKDKRADQLHD